MSDQTTPKPVDVIVYVDNAAAPVVSFDIAPRMACSVARSRSNWRRAP